MAGMIFIRDLAVVMMIAGAVGWICQRIGLSVVVGYLLAGVVIGPFTPPFQLVADLDRVQMLAQVGLVFLIFSIGLGFSVQRLQRLGATVILATIISSILTFTGCRLLGLTLAWSPIHSLFFAGMLMVSSSAIISKVLEEINSTHERHGQLALGVTVLEDVVAVVMLTLLNSMIQLGSAQSATLLPAIGSLGAFLVFLAIISLLVIPRLLARLGRTASEELRTIIVAGLLLALAWAVAGMGYSPALGAFVLGAIVASTRQKDEVERTFEGIRQMFGAVFFVAMGMLFDVSLLKEVWWLVILLSVFSLCMRTVACTLGLVAIGTSSRDALRAGLALNPIGEFSFIIAQIGVAAAVLPPQFYPIAVGISLATSVLAPILMRRSEKLSNWVHDKEPLFVREWLTFYNRWLTQLRSRREASMLWRLTAKRVLQTGLLMLFASALLLFGNLIYRRAVAALGEDWLFPQGLKIIFWTAFGAVLLAPLIAIWRNVSALSMILAEGATADQPRQAFLKPLMEGALRTTALLVLAAWLVALTPFQLSVLWVLAITAALLGLLAAVFWRRLINWHSRLEIELMEQVKRAKARGAAGVTQTLLERRANWNLHIDEIILPADSPHAGKTIHHLALRALLGCSIVGIDRQGFAVANPAADTILYPGDKLLILGTTEQIAQANQFLRKPPTDGARRTDFDELNMETVPVPMNSPRAGGSLAHLDIIRKFGVQIGGIDRAGRKSVIPRGTDTIEAGDELLVLGTHEQIRNFRIWLEPEPVTAEPTPSTETNPDR